MDYSQTVALGIAILALAVVIGLFFRRRRMREQIYNNSDNPESSPLSPFDYHSHQSDGNYATTHASPSAASAVAMRRQPSRNGESGDGGPMTPFHYRSDDDDGGSPATAAFVAGALGGSPLEAALATEFTGNAGIGIAVGLADRDTEDHESAADADATGYSSNHDDAPANDSPSDDRSDNDSSGNDN